MQEAESARMEPWQTLLECGTDVTPQRGRNSRELQGIVQYRLAPIYGLHPVSFL